MFYIETVNFMLDKLPSEEIGNNCSVKFLQYGNENNKDIIYRVFSGQSFIDVNKAAEGRWIILQLMVDGNYQEFSLDDIVFFDELNKALKLLNKDYYVETKQA